VGFGRERGWVGRCRWGGLKTWERMTSGSHVWVSGMKERYKEDVCGRSRYKGENFVDQIKYRRVWTVLGRVEVLLCHAGTDSLRGTEPIELTCADLSTAARRQRQSTLASSMITRMQAGRPIAAFHQIVMYLRHGWLASQRQPSGLFAAAAGTMRGTVAQMNVREIPCMHGSEGANKARTNRCTSVWTWLHQSINKL
jgi:hypothetical protein